MVSDLEAEEVGDLEDEELEALELEAVHHQQKN